MAPPLSKEVTQGGHFYRVLAVWNAYEVPLWAHQGPSLSLGSLARSTGRAPTTPVALLGPGLGVSRLTILQRHDLAVCERSFSLALSEHC